jgi:hypothetical protein
MTTPCLLGCALAAAPVVGPVLALAQSSTANGARDQLAAQSSGPAAGQTVGNVGNGNYTGTPTPIPPNSKNSSQSAASSGLLRPSQRNPDLADNGDALASKVVGTDVYNSHNQKLGSVDDILIRSNCIFAVISTDQKNVTVPFQNLVFGDAWARSDDKLVLPNMTQAELNEQPAFHYNATNYASNQNGLSGSRGVFAGPACNNGGSASFNHTGNAPANGSNQG